MSDKPNLVERVARKLSPCGTSSWVMCEQICEQCEHNSRQAIEEVSDYLHEELGQTYTATGTRIRVMLREQLEEK